MTPKELHSQIIKVCNDEGRKVECGGLLEDMAKKGWHKVLGYQKHDEYIRELAPKTRVSQRSLYAYRQVYQEFVESGILLLDEAEKCYSKLSRLLRRGFFKKLPNDQRAKWLEKAKSPLPVRALGRDIDKQQLGRITPTTQRHGESDEHRKVKEFVEANLKRLDPNLEPYALSRSTEIRYVDVAARDKTTRKFVPIEIVTVEKDERKGIVSLEGYIVKWCKKGGQSKKGFLVGPGFDKPTRDRRKQLQEAGTEIVLRTFKEIGYPHQR